jgi:CheY-like chemotaxis protein
MLLINLGYFLYRVTKNRDEYKLLLPPLCATFRRQNSSTVANILAFLIDDDQDDQLFFELAISEIEFEVDFLFADDALKGLDMLTNPEFNPDFIFVDMNMPKINGLECLVKIKEIERIKHLPVFMYSTTADENIAKTCTELGAAGLIKKETSVSAISEKLQHVFESKIALINRKL